MLHSLLFVMGALAAPAHLAELDRRGPAALRAALEAATEPAERATLAAALVWAEHPDPALRAWQAAPTLTRNRMPIFAAPELGAPEIGPVLLDRLRHGAPPEEWRAALAQNAVRAGAVEPGLVPVLLGEEPSAAARAVLLGALARAPIEEALPALRLGLLDADPAVRATALEVLAGHPDGAAGVELVRQGLLDADPAVRAAAQQAIGWRGLAALWAQAEAGLADPDPQVRVKALRALERLDAARAAALPAVAALAADADPRVARVARRLRP